VSPASVTLALAPRLVVGAPAVLVMVNAGLTSTGWVVVQDVHSGSGSPPPLPTTLLPTVPDASALIVVV
jgi:hypothetical protein